MSEEQGTQGQDLSQVKLLVDDPESGSRLVDVPGSIAAAFRAGDRILVLPESILHIPQAQIKVAQAAVQSAAAAFTEMSRIQSDQVTRFYQAFAGALAEDRVRSDISEANARDVADAARRGRSTTRLALSEKMRADMVRGLREWAAMPSPIGKVLETTPHKGWRVEHVYSPLGVVAFVFEGRPNVFADATGVLRSGNTAVMRIGGDALGTARAILELALAPALRSAALPEGAVSLVQSREHAAGWALFSDRRVALAIARGSGPATRQLGAIARSAGIPASLHGAGGAWLVADDSADASRFYKAIFHSLDRKVCNTLNTVCLTREAADRLAPVFLQAVRDRGACRDASGTGFRLHATESARPYLPPDFFTTETAVYRVEGECREMLATLLPTAALSQEWEWEKTPELSVAVAADLAEAAALVNRHSPQFVASLISEDREAQELFFSAVNAPFVGDGFTRWVDGQFALNRPELGLSNWQSGRLFGRSGILSGDGIFTVRLRMYQQDTELHR